MSEFLYSLKEAARYLGISVATVKYHVYKSGLLTGQVIGNTRIFTKSELDAFKNANYKPGWKKGRKRKKE